MSSPLSVGGVVGHARKREAAIGGLSGEFWGLQLEAGELTYLYTSRSQCVELPDAFRLALATSGGVTVHPRLYAGQVLHPRQTAAMLLAVARVARTRFYTPAAMYAAVADLADPIVTAGGGSVRFESFSQCAGVYVRFDLHRESLDDGFLTEGSTNVDFNAAMCAALARVTDAAGLRLDIGWDDVAVTSGPNTTVERRVALPSRWVRGLAEVQLAQARMQCVAELPAAPARRFLGSIPTRPADAPALWLTPSAGTLRLSARSSPGAVAVGGIERLRFLSHAARFARSLRVYGSENGETAWELVLDGASLHVVLSTAARNAFSGEGDVLWVLGDPVAGAAATSVRASLSGYGHIDAGAVARGEGCSHRVASRALVYLGAVGVLGYDLAAGHYFRRELPLPRVALTSMHPRLRAAQALASGAAVTVNALPMGVTEALVTSDGVAQRVALWGDDIRCSCPWFARHEWQRGPCKHALAALITIAARAASPSPA